MENKRYYILQTMRKTLFRPSVDFIFFNIYIFKNLPCYSQGGIAWLTSHCACKVRRNVIKSVIPLQAQEK